MRGWFTNELRKLRTGGRRVFRRAWEGNRQEDWAHTVRRLALTRGRIKSVEGFCESIMQTADVARLRNVLSETFLPGYLKDGDTWTETE